MNPFLDSLCNFAFKNIGLPPGVNFEWFPGPQDAVDWILKFQFSIWPLNCQTSQNQSKPAQITNSVWSKESTAGVYKKNFDLLIRVVGKDEKRKPITVKGLLDNGGGSVFAFHPQTMMMIIVHTVSFVQKSFQINLNHWMEHQYLNNFKKTNF